jgi:hypothetical protein
MANYVVPDSTGSLVSASFPYSKLFVTAPRASSGKAYLTLTVKTAYTDPSFNAAVKINGTTIGTIDPRPWTNHFILDMETVIFVFDNTLLVTSLFSWPFLIPAINTLQIIRQGNLADPTNFLLVGAAICHYQ